MTKNDFTDSEWELIVSAPSLVGMAISAASPSGLLGVVRELFAVGVSVEDLAAARPENSLIQAVIVDIRRHDTPTVRPDPKVGVDNAKQWALAELARVSRVLGSDEDDGEVLEFKRWLVEVAARVARAATEGGFLGIGGQQVTGAEELALDEVRAALGIA